MRKSLADHPMVVAVILNWNNAADTIECLRSVADLDYPNVRILVVDNGSTDGSASRIRNEHPDVQIIETGKNLGYAGGNNIGLARAMEEDPHYILLLNNDVTVDTCCLTHLVGAGEHDLDVAFLGPKVYHREDPERLQSTGGVLDWLLRSQQRGLDELDVGQFDEIEEVDYVIGAAMLVRVAAISGIGLLNADFFLYREDVDWCLRAASAGYRTLYVPEAKVWHRSHHVRDDERPRTTYYMTRNAYLLLSTNRAPLSVYVLATLQNLLWLLNWTINPKWRHKREERDALLKALVDALLGRWGRQPYGYGL